MCIFPLYIVEDPKRQKLKTGKKALLWGFKRSMASREIKTVMNLSDIHGLHATANCVGTVNHELLFDELMRKLQSLSCHSALQRIPR